MGRRRRFLASTADSYHEAGEEVTAEVMVVLNFFRELSNGGDEHGGLVLCCGHGEEREGEEMGRIGGEEQVRLGSVPLTAGEGQGRGPSKGRRWCGTSSTPRSLQEEEEGELAKSPLANLFHHQQVLPSSLLIPTAFQEFY